MASCEPAGRGGGPSREEDLPAHGNRKARNTEDHVVTVELAGSGSASGGRAQTCQDLPSRQTAGLDALPLWRRGDRWEGHWGLSAPHQGPQGSSLRPSLLCSGPQEGGRVGTVGSWYLGLLWLAFGCAAACLCPILAAGSDVGSCTRGGSQSRGQEREGLGPLLWVRGSV